VDTIDTSRRDLIEEFRRRPVGGHSADLRVLLNLLRTNQGEEPYILVCTKPHREWLLARKSGERGSPVRVVEGVLFHSPEEAEWEVFKRLWQEQTGEALE
jgi:branched-chain amino acid transport system permease protein